MDFSSTWARCRRAECKLSGEMMPSIKACGTDLCILYYFSDRKLDMKIDRRAIFFRYLGGKRFRVVISFKRRLHNTNLSEEAIKNRLAGH